MDPESLFEDGQLSAAIAGQRAVVAGEPTSAGARLFLCELLAFDRDWAAVRFQLAELLRVCSEEQGMAEYAADWLALIEASEKRAGSAPPSVLIEPPSSLDRRRDARSAISDGDSDRAIDLLEQADETACEVEGFVDGRPFEGFRDADELQGPVLEAYFGAEWVWIPIEQVAKLRLAEVDGPRDRLFRPATVTLIDRSEWDVYLPVIYPGPSDDVDILCGRGTDWVEECGITRAVGSRMLMIGEEELTFDDFTQIEIR